MSSGEVVIESKRSWNMVFRFSKVERELLGTTIRTKNVVLALSYKMSIKLRGVEGVGKLQGDDHGTYRPMYDPSPTLGMPTSIDFLSMYSLSVL